MKPANKFALLVILGLVPGTAIRSTPPRLSGRFSLMLFIDSGSSTPAAGVSGTIVLSPVAATGRPTATGHYQAPTWLERAGPGPRAGDGAGNRE